MMTSSGEPKTVAWIWAAFQPGERERRLNRTSWIGPTGLATTSSSASPSGPSRLGVELVWMRSDNAWANCWSVWLPLLVTDRVTWLALVFVTTTPRKATGLGLPVTSQPRMPLAKVSRQVGLLAVMKQVRAEALPIELLAATETCAPLLDMSV